jgi:hypothetical protein
MIPAIYKFMGGALVMSSVALLALTLCLHSALKADGIVIGSPKVVYQYISAPTHNSVSMTTDKTLLTKAGIQVAMAAGARR